VRVVQFTGKERPSDLLDGMCIVAEWASKDAFDEAAITVRHHYTCLSFGSWFLFVFVLHQSAH
jgi:hypothetical protein